MIRMLISSSLIVFSCIAASAQQKSEANDGYRVDFSQLQSITNDKASSAFTALKKLGVPYKYPQGGCESRAYLMGLQLDSMHIPNFRVWLLAPPAYEANSEGALVIKDLNDPSNEIKWTYHTAPAVLVRNGSTVDTVVLDPAINSRTCLQLSAWMASMKGAEKARYYLVPNRYFGYYSNNNLMNGNFYLYEGFAYDNMTAEKNLALDYVGRYIQRMYLKPSGKKYDPTRIGRLKPIVSNIYSFQQYILQNTLPQQSGTERSFYEQSPDFIIDCKNVFNRELRKFHNRIVRLQSM